MNPIERTSAIKADLDAPEPSEMYRLYSALRAKGMHRGVYLTPGQAAQAMADAGNLVVGAVHSLELHEAVDVAGLVASALLTLEREIGSQIGNSELASAAVRGAVLDYVGAYPQDITLLTTRNPRAN